jgi:dCMP deaminase
MRATWDQTWMRVADAVGQRSRCSKAQVGAVIVDKNNRICAVGYNGPPSKFAPANRDSMTMCNEWCDRIMTGSTSAAYDDCPSIHAETNAIAVSDVAARDGGTIYVTGAICFTCAKLISNSGIYRVVMRVTPAMAYRNPEEVSDFIRRCGITVVHVNEEAV